MNSSSYQFHMNVKSKKQKKGNKSHSQGTSGSQGRKIAQSSLPFNYFTLNNDIDDKITGPNDQN